MPDLDFLNRSHEKDIGVVDGSDVDGWVVSRRGDRSGRLCRPCFGRAEVAVGTRLPTASRVVNTGLAARVRPGF